MFASINVKFGTGSGRKKTIFGPLSKTKLSYNNCAMLVCKVVEVWQDFLSEYVDKKFTYICYRWLIRHE